jgi:hypothetical protein
MQAMLRLVLKQCGKSGLLHFWLWVAWRIIEDWIPPWANYTFSYKKGQHPSKMGEVLELLNTAMKKYYDKHVRHWLLGPHVGVMPCSLR